MADETPDTPTAAEDAAKAALKQAGQKGMTKEEARADDRTKVQEKQADETAEQLKRTPDDGEVHLVSDLMAASVRLWGVPPEMVAGAAQLAGLGMTEECTITVLRRHIKAYMAHPA